MISMEFDTATAKSDGDNLNKKSKFGQFPQGIVRFRMLPWFPVPRRPYFIFKQHFIPNNDALCCLNSNEATAFTCPICAELAVLSKSQNPVEQEIAKSSRATNTVAVNMWIRGQEASGVQVMRAPKTLSDYIFGKAQDDPATYNLLFDIYRGFDMSLKRTGQGLKTDYSMLDRVGQCMLGRSVEESEAILRSAHNLEEYLWDPKPADEMLHIWKYANGFTGTHSASSVQMGGMSAGGFIAPPLGGFTPPPSPSFTGQGFVPTPPPPATHVPQVDPFATMAPMTGAIAQGEFVPPPSGPPQSFTPAPPLPMQMMGGAPPSGPAAPQSPYPTMPVVPQSVSLPPTMSSDPSPEELQKQFAARRKS